MGVNIYRSKMCYVPKTAIHVEIISISEKKGELMESNMEVRSVLVDVRSIIRRKILKLRQRCFNTFTAIVDLSRFNNSCLKSPASTLVDLTFQSRALRSFSLNQLRNLSL